MILMQHDFAIKATRILKEDPNVIGLAVGGSWLTNEIDEYSDLDLILITKQKVSNNIDKMLEYANRLDHFLSGFTGEHVGEPRVLICLYDKPLLHVDIKFLTLEELNNRVETPSLLFDRNGQIEKLLDQTTHHFPFPDYQWIEDRFWTWIHYTLLKIGRGEYFEAYDFFSFLRMSVLGPLLHIKNGNLPRAVRKVETELSKNDLEQLKLTLPKYEKQSLLNSLKNAVYLYKELRTTLFDNTVKLHYQVEEKVMTYFNQIENN